MYNIMSALLTQRRYTGKTPVVQPLRCTRRVVGGEVIVVVHCVNSLFVTAKLTKISGITKTFAFEDALSVKAGDVIRANYIVREERQVTLRFCVRR